ncbi:c-type cytochrome, partial [Klebsiella variicola]|uniref:c-type cytochrome n=1 Tax=Klebsiella variicola TaxID=244366 RepID=UPI003877EE97
TQHMTDADLKAIATYLKDLPAVTPAVSAAPPLPETDPVMVAGKAIYLDNCSACHVSSGAGVPRSAGNMRGNAVVQAPDGST